MTNRPLHRLLIALLTAVVAATVAAPVAMAAKPTHKKAIRGPVQVDGKSQFPLYRELGVGIFQYSLSWPGVAGSRPAHPTDPSDPAYHWPATLDFAVKESARYGMQVSLLIGRAPSWSNGGLASNFPPTDTRDYADFLEAAARRYPKVRLWMIYGEPIRYPNFFLHYKDKRQRNDNSPLTPDQRGDAQRYAEILDASYVRLKQLSRRNKVIGGNTTTNGDFFGPFQWIKNLKLPDGKPPRMDMFGHNPFGSRQPDLRKKQLVPGTADFCDLDVLVKWLDRYLHRGGRNRKLPIFIGEFTAPTDVPSYEFPFHVTRKTQARWLSAGLRITRRWSRIYTFGWIGLYDPPKRSDGTESRTGLLTAGGKRKPSFNAYKRG